MDIICETSLRTIDQSVAKILKLYLMTFPVPEVPPTTNPTSDLQSGRYLPYRRHDPPPPHTRGSQTTNSRCLQ